jgi:hypothetical protein
MSDSTLFYIAVALIGAVLGAVAYGVADLIDRRFPIVAETISVLAIFVASFLVLITLVAFLVVFNFRPLMLFLGAAAVLTFFCYVGAKARPVERGSLGRRALVFPFALSFGIWMDFACVTAFLTSAKLSFNEQMLFATFLIAHIGAVFTAPLLRHVMHMALNWVRPQTE